MLLKVLLHLTFASLRIHHARSLALSLSRSLALSLSRSLVLFVLSLLSIATLATGEASAQFTWKTYVGTNGTTYTYPRWDETNTPAVAYLSQAIAELNLPTGKTLDEAMIKIYVPGTILGSYSPTPSITLVAKKPGDAFNKITGPVVVPNTGGMVQKWTMEWGDDILGILLQTIKRNITVKVEVVTKTTQNNNQTTDVLGPWFSTSTKR